MPVDLLLGKKQPERIVESESETESESEEEITPAQVGYVIHVSYFRTSRILYL